MTKFRTHHNWNFTDLNLVILKQRLFTDYGPYSCLLIFITQLNFLYFNGSINFSLISESADTRLMRENVLIRAVRLMHARKLVNCRVAENHLICCLLVIAPEVNFFFLDSGHSKLFNDLLD